MNDWYINGIYNDKVEMKQPKNEQRGQKEDNGKEHWLLNGIEVPKVSQFVAPSVPQELFQASLGQKKKHIIVCLLKS